MASFPGPWLRRAAVRRRDVHADGANVDRGTIRDGSEISRISRIGIDRQADETIVEPPVAISETAGDRTEQHSERKAPEFRAERSDDGRGDAAGKQCGQERLHILALGVVVARLNALRVAGIGIGHGSREYRYGFGHRRYSSNLGDREGQASSQQGMGLAAVRRHAECMNIDWLCSMNAAGGSIVTWMVVSSDAARTGLAGSALITPASQTPPCTCHRH
jgi:hypothetical protein